jgi:DNA-binding NarL/FixJ family response regulator
MNTESDHRPRQPIRVMIVENHQLILWGLDKLINGQRPYMEVAGIACNPAEAITRAAHAAPDVVLLKYEFAHAAATDDLCQALNKAGCRTLLFMDDLTSEALQISLRSGAHGLLTRKSRAEEVVKAIEKTHGGELWFGREATGMALNAMRESKVQAEAGGTELDLLTPRERKVLRAVMENKVRTNKDLARQLFISESTLRNHLSSIYQKFGVSNRLDLYVYAQNRGIVPD